MRQWAGRSSQPLAPRLIKTQNGKPQQRAAVGPRAPPPEEEDPRVKCKDCGAFGHTARSRRCPMKCWDVALAPQPLGPRKEKENQAPSKPENVQNTGGLHLPDRQKEHAHRQEEAQGKALLQKFPRRPQGSQHPKWKEVTEPCSSLRLPSEPLPMHSTRMSSVLGHVFESQPGVKVSNEGPTMRSTHHFHRPEVGLSSCLGIQKRQDMTITGTIQPAVRPSVQKPVFLVKKADEMPEVVSSKAAKACAKSHGQGHVHHHQALVKCPAVRKEPCLEPSACTEGPDPQSRAPGKRQAQAHIQTCQNAPKKLRLGGSLAPQVSTGRKGLAILTSLRALQDTCGISLEVSPNVSRDTPPHDSSMDLLPPEKSCVFKLVQPCTQPTPPAPSCVPRQPLRMVFKRMHHDCWTSTFIAAPPSPPLAKPNALAKSPPYLDVSEGHSSHVPVSVLYEDLQVSSSSEDSDME